ncbi:adhesion G-protein coupled receptor F3 [Bombina bombina]|uniref:adhesion G-protein coupled receptor F3 n=1 Tax=Bombina bombina TaxID=8345 RepID=UPI00235A4C88|nr:adhesion G-protein coupled receptor F3 [Bombina bombina]
MWGVCTGPGTKSFSSCQSKSLYTYNVNDICIINPTDSQSFYLASQWCQTTESYYYEYPIIDCFGPLVHENSTIVTTTESAQSSTTEQLIQTTTESAQSSTTEQFIQTTTESAQSSTMEQLIQTTTESAPSSTTEQLIQTTTESAPSTTEQLIQTTTESAPSSTTEQLIQTTTESAPSSTTEQLIQTTTEYAPSSTIEKLIQTTTESAPSSTTEQLIQTTTESAQSSTTEQLIQTTTESAPSSTTEQLIQTTTESAQSSTTEQFIQTTTESAQSSTTEQLIQTTTESAQSSTTEQLIQTTTESAQSSTTEQLIQTTTESAPSSTTEQLIQTTTESAHSSTTEQFIQTTTESAQLSTTEQLIQTTTESAPSSTTEQLIQTTTESAPGTTEQLIQTTTESAQSSTTEQLIQTTTESAPSSTTEQLIQTTTESAPGTTEQLIQTTTESAQSSTTEQLIQTTTESAQSSTTEQLIQTTTESAPGTTEQLIQTTTESAQSSTTEQLIQTTTESAPSSTTEQLIQTTTESAPSTTEQLIQITTESAPSSTTEQLIQTTTESAPSTTEQLIQTTTESAPSPTEQLIQTTTESAQLSTTEQLIQTTTESAPSSTTEQLIQTTTESAPSTTEQLIQTTTESAPSSTIYTTVLPTSVTSEASLASTTALPAVVTSSTTAFSLSSDTAAAYSGLTTTSTVSSSSDPVVTQLTSTSVSPTTVSPVKSTFGVSDLQLWAELSSLNFSEAEGRDLLESLWQYSASSKFQQDEEVVLGLYILGNITVNFMLANIKFTEDNVKKVLYISDQLFNYASSIYVQNKRNEIGPQVLELLENIFANMNVTTQPFNVSYQNIEFQLLASSCSDIKKETILEAGMGATISLPPKDTNQDFPPGCLINVLSMSYRPQNTSFPNQYDNKVKTINTYLASDIMTKVILLNNNKYSSAYINMTFKCTSGLCDQTAICVFWDFLLNKWSSEGCTTQVQNGVTQCFCSHLTSFSVLMSSSIPEDTMNDKVLDYITKIGLGISILSLVICISLQGILLRHAKNPMASYRHIALLNMSLFLLLSNVSFIASDFVTPKLQEILCLVFTFCTHFSLVAYFCWTLVQSLFLVSRLVFVFHHVTKKEFASLSVVLGYICPIAIAVTTFLVYSPANMYRKENACFLNSQSGASMAFIVPTIIAMAVNFLALAVVISKLLRPSISESKNEDEEVVKKLVKAVVFCTPQFGLTWAIGIPLLRDGENLIALHYLFVLLNPLQGFFILLFACLLDKKVMDLLKKRLCKVSTVSSTATTTSTY